MSSHKATYKIWIHLTVAIFVFAVLVVDFVLFVQHLKKETVVTQMIRYFSYFTILSNWIFGISSIILAWKPHIRSQIFHAFRLEAIVCMMITGIVFHSVLKSTSHPTTLTSYITSEFFHTVNPILAFLVWYLVDNKPMITKRITVMALIPPFIYAVYIFVRGYFTGSYPYFFVNVNKVGGWMSVISVCIIIFMFLGLTWVMSLLEKYSVNKSH